MYYRNDHLVVCSLIAASCPGAPFVVGLELMYNFVFMSVCVLYVRTYICTYVRTMSVLYIRMYVKTQKCYVYAYIVNIRTYEVLCTCTYVCTYVRMYIHHVWEV